MKKGRLAMTLLVLSMLIAHTVGTVRAQVPELSAGSLPAPGDLDPTFGGFGSGGMVMDDISGGDEGINAAALQPDGKIVALGPTLLARYHPNGTRDNTFGIVTVDFGSSPVAARALAIQPDGKILVAGSAGLGNWNFGLARYHPNGSPDTTFDGDGIVTTDFGGSEHAYAIALQPDGKIIVAGYEDDCGAIFGCNHANFALARYQPNGSLDTTFAKDGKVTTDFNGREYAYAIALQPDGKIVLAGYESNCTSIICFDNDFALARYHSNGNLDTTFDDDGKVTTDFGDYEMATSIALQPDDKIVVFGYGLNTSNYDFALLRYNPNGSLDATFDDDGIVMTDFGAREDAGAIALQPDGKIVGVGRSFLGGDPDFALARYNTDGSLDTTFNGTGMQSTDFGGDDWAFDLLIQPDGRLVVAGEASNGSNLDFALARYFPDGTLDEGGRVTTSFYPGADEFASAMAVQSDGKIVAAGSYEPSDNQDFALTRYGADGSLDPTFDGDGRAIFDLAGDEEATAMALTPDGKMVVAGHVMSSGESDFLVARFNANGALDTSFGSGFIVTGFGWGDDSAQAVALQPDGKIVLAGSAWTGSSFAFALARFNPNSALDSSFGTGGKAMVDFGGLLNGAFAVALQPDGKILVGGIGANDSDYDFAIARFNADGSPDISFDGDGKLTTNIQGNDFATAMALLPDGRILVAGSAHDGVAFNFAMVRYHPDGALDSTFGWGGIVITDLGGDDWAHALVRTSDGRAIVAGCTTRNGVNRFAVAVYTASGILNTDFHSTGWVSTGFGVSGDCAKAVAVGPDNKIVVAGSSHNGSTGGGNLDFALARYELGNSSAPGSIRIFLPLIMR